MNVVDVLFAAATENPNKIAIVEGDKKQTYSQFITDINNTIIYLNQKGIKPNDRVLLAVPISYTMYVYFAATLSIGATLVVIDGGSSIKKINSYLLKADCKAVVIAPKYYLLSFLIKNARKIPLKIKAKIGKGNNETILPIYNSEAQHPALITFTTGSTGQPKAAIRTHKVLMEQFRLLNIVFNFNSTDIVMSNLPIVTLLGFAGGGTAVLPKKASYKSNKGWAKVSQQAQHNGVNCLLGSPAFLLHLSINIPKNYNQSIKKVGIGGATVTAKQWQRLQNNLPASTISVIYGSTEAEPISVCNTLPIVGNKIGVLVGKPVEGVEVKIIPISFNEYKIMPLPYSSNQVGEIVVSGAQVVNNYLDGEDIFKLNKIIEGEIIWHRTGDAGYFNTAGELFFCGRTKYMFVRDGEMYSPLAYELFFEGLEGNIEGTALLIDNKIRVFIKAGLAINKQEILQGLAAAGLPYDKLIFVRTLPKDKRHHSKINYDALAGII